MASRTSFPSAVVPAPDTAQIREMLGMMKATLGTLGQTFHTLNEQSSKMANLGPTMQHASMQIQGLRHQIRKQDKKQELRVQEVKDLIQNQFKEQVTKDMRSHVDENIKREIELQVREQVNLQMKEHLAVSWHQQAEESRKQLVEVRHALMNSEARRANSSLRTDNLNDQLAVVLKPDGTRSDVYPANLRSLFSYSTEMLRALMKDYDLIEHIVREKNLNRFMAHIGITFQLVPMPASGTDGNKGTDGEYPVI